MLYRIIASDSFLKAGGPGDWSPIETWIPSYSENVESLAIVPYKFY